MSPITCAQYVSTSGICRNASASDTSKVRSPETVAVSLVLLIGLGFGVGTRVVEVVVEVTFRMMDFS